jgi:hypothetical protein
MKQPHPIVLIISLVLVTLTIFLPVLFIEDNVDQKNMYATKILTRSNLKLLESEHALTRIAIRLVSRARSPTVQLPERHSHLPRRRSLSRRLVPLYIGNGSMATVSTCFDDN